MSLVSSGTGVQGYVQNSKLKINNSPKKLNPKEVSFKQEINDLQVFCHHIYEYKKGLRNLVLTTEKAQNKDQIEKRLIREHIPYIIHQVSKDKINVYFGNQHCIDIITRMNPVLSKLSAEQDFILGIMLGYDRLQQCERYLKMVDKGLKLNELA